MNQPALGIELDSPYELTPQQIKCFRGDGFVKLKGVFTGDELSFYGDEITRIVTDLNPRKGVPMQQRGTYAKAFIQIGNLWTKSEVVKRFSFGRVGGGEAVFVRQTVGAGCHRVDRHVGRSDVARPGAL